MIRSIQYFAGVGAVCASFLCLWPLSGATPPASAATGPETEKRFPPLQLPDGFEATLFACDPLIEYPSAIALGPRPGTLFVAVDYMTGLGTDIVRRDEIRLLEDIDRDGYADQAGVYSSEFNSIQGLTFHDGTVYVMHAPFLTALTDTDRDGRADHRRDLLAGLGLPPEKNPVRLHCANGLIAGHDGWLYLALGDHGCGVTRPEGDRLVLEGGGILRCRPDGRDLHVFATGLRNIYDVALDDELNVFVRDNENDGGDYKIRVCHSFFGADHGYPYLYYERPEEALPPLGDLGLGSSAGGLCYLENSFPPEYRGNLFFCEWGRSVVRYPLRRSSSGFAPVQEREFASAANNDPYGFKPTDLVVDRDGAMFIADWADGQRPKRGRGRIYRITFSSGLSRAAVPPPSETVSSSHAKQGLGPRLVQLDSESYHERLEAQLAMERQGDEGLQATMAALRQGRLQARGRLHAVWIAAKLGGPNALPTLLTLAGNDPEARVRAQAIRAISDLTNPIFTQHRLDAGPGDARLAGRLAALAQQDAEPQVRFEAIIALGRLRWAGAPAWFRDTPMNMDSALSHAALQTLRRSENWRDILDLLDAAGDSPVRRLAKHALAGQAHSAVVDGLIERLWREPNPARRIEYAGALARVHRKPGPWVYWGYRPPPRPANTESWERTELIQQALDALLADPERTVRRTVLQRMQREKVPAQPATLNHWLRDERDPETVAAILNALREHPAEAVHHTLAAVIREREHAQTNRLEALALLANALEAPIEAEGRWLELAAALEDGPVLAQTLRHLPQRPRIASSALLIAKLNSPEPAVRAAAAASLADLQATEASEAVSKLLEDSDARVRLAAASAAGQLGIRSASTSLLKLAHASDPGLRRACLESLRLLKEIQAVTLAAAALDDRETQAVALRCLEELGGPPHLKPVVGLARRDPSRAVLSALARVWPGWASELPIGERAELDRALAELQGATGLLLRWQIAAPFTPELAAALAPEASGADSPTKPDLQGRPWGMRFMPGSDSRVTINSSADAESALLARTDAHVTESAAVQFLATGRNSVRIWLNGEELPSRQEDRAGPGRPASFDATLRAGANRVLVLAHGSGLVEFGLGFRRRTGDDEREQLMQAALSRTGNAARGRSLFFDTEKSQCLKCHRLAAQGERIGPELTGIGSRFSRVHIIESILEPSRSITPGFQSTELILKDGRELSGILAGDEKGKLTLADAQGSKHAVAMADIQTQRTASLSVMPEGLEKAWTTGEFIDLIEFLVSQKEPSSP